MRVPLIMAFISYLVLLLTDAYIWWDIRYWTVRKGSSRQGRGGGKKWSTLYLCFAAAVLILLTVALCLPRRSVSEDITTLMWMLYTVLTISLAQIIYVVFSLIGFIPLIAGKNRFNAGLWIALPLALVIFGCMWWGALIGRKQIEVNEVDIVSQRLPESFNGYKVAQISDLHVGTWGNDTAFLSRLVDTVNDLHPDLIVFTGDIVNRHTDELKPFVGTLSRLHAPDGVISVLGNHDYGDYITWDTPEDKMANLQALRDIQRKEMNWILLDNESMSIRNEKGDSIIVIGVENWGEPPFTKYGDLKKAYPEEKFRDDNFKLLLSHNPEHWNQEVSRISNMDLTLSGHTHAMQFMLKLGGWRWSPSKYRYEQWEGLYERGEGPDKVRLYVNIGAGEVGFPMRFGATPEVTLFTFRK